MGENSWIIKIKEKVSHLEDITGTEMEDREQHSIYKLPAYFTGLNELAYKPQAISFGPYHYGEWNLKPMEVHKERALLLFLKRSRKPPEDYVGALGKILQHLKNAYDVLQQEWLADSDAFLELMLRDGCFMIEILRASSTDNQTGIAGYARNDPIFSSHGKLYVWPLIKRDMLMLENQLPMLLLKTLLAVDNQTEEENINVLIREFYFHTWPTEMLGHELDKCLHVLDAYRRILLWTEVPSPTQTLPPHSPRLHHIFSAKELQEAGIRIRRSKYTSLKAIHFDLNTGILSLPQIIVDDDCQVIFLNLVAFERFHVGAGNGVTDYILFMDEIIDNATDVNILQIHDVIHNAFGSEKDVAELFNSLTEDLVLVSDIDSSLNKVRVAINCYCRNLSVARAVRRKWLAARRKWPDWWAALMETYYRNPLSFISVVAAIILFALTITQTTYGALQYYQALNNSLSPPPPRRS